MTHPVCGPIGMKGASKFFFSEEKKQKAFANSGVSSAWKVCDSN
jgi:hypothetical protein